MRTATVAAITGLTFRRLDYLTRNGPLAHTHPELNGGSGCHRTWPTDIVTRLAVASQVNQALPELDLPHVAELVLDGPEPPSTGWAILRPHQQPAVVYVAHPADLAGALIAHHGPPGASLVVPIDLRPVEVYLAALAADRPAPPVPCDECETTGVNCRAHRVGANRSLSAATAR